MSTTSKLESSMILVADSHHGQYIPQLVTKGEINNPNWDWSNVSKEDIKSLKKGPSDDFYWDAWDNATNNIKIKDNTGREYFLHQDGDLWAIPQDCADQMDELFGI